MCGCNKYKTATAPRNLPGVRTTPNLASRAATAPAPAAAPAPALALALAPALATVDTSIWGPSLWKIIHIAAIRSVSRDVIPLWRNLLDAMKSGLPCPDCSAHYNNWYRSHPLRFGLMPNSFQGTIARWVNDLHNDVNRRTGKGSWSPQQVIATHGSNLNTAKELTADLRGMLGDNVTNALNALLRTL